MAELDYLGRVRALAGELFDARRGGRPFQPASLAGASTLKALDCVARETGLDEPTDDDRMAAAFELVKRGVRQTSRSHTVGLTAALSILMGLEHATQTFSMERRYAEAAKHLHSAPGTVRDSERTYYEELAKTILDFERESRLAAVGMVAGSRSLTIDWLAEFRTYFKVWATYQRLRGDLIAAGRKRRGDPAGRLTYEDYLASSLYSLILSLHQIRDYVLQDGGLWALPDPDDERELVDVVYVTGYFSHPFSSREASFLRTALRQAELEEDAFLETLEQSDRGRALLEEWQTWESSCQCEDGEEYESCYVHMTISACGKYIALIQESWTQLAEWWRTVPVDIMGIDPAYAHDILLRSPHP
ncbi:MAG: hypothetical protein ACYDA2_04220 [Acidimicrobiales bacterium]